VSLRIRRPDGAYAKSGLRLRLMILALRILYFEDLSVGMTEFIRAQEAAQGGGKLVTRWKRC
jgi:hypothetical protein